MIFKVPANPNQSMILFLSLGAAGKTVSDKDEMDGDFWLLKGGQLVQLWWGTGEPCFPREAGLAPLMQDLTPTLPQRLHLGLEPPAYTRLTPSLALPSLDTLGTSRKSQMGKSMNVFWEHILCMMYLWKVEVFLYIYIYMGCVYIYICIWILQCNFSVYKMTFIWVCCFQS